MRPVRRSNGTRTVPSSSAEKQAAIAHADSTVASVGRESAGLVAMSAKNASKLES